MSGLNGLSFLMLALAILNFGWKLEAIISKAKVEVDINVKSMSERKNSSKLHST